MQRCTFFVFVIVLVFLKNYHANDIDDHRTNETGTKVTLTRVREFFKIPYPATTVTTPYDTFFNSATIALQPMNGGNNLSANLSGELLDSVLPPSPSTTLSTVDSFSFSPVTLDEKWNKLERLLFVLFCASFGTIMNGFFVAAFFVESTLKKVGNVFLACLGMADMVITTGVMPTVTVVLLSGEWDNIPVCQALHFATLVSTYCYSIFFGFVGVETFYRLYRSTNEYEWFVSMRVGVVAVLILSVSVTLSSLGVYMDLDVDYCQRLHQGNFYFRVITGVLLHIIPGTITLASLSIGACGIRKRARKQSTYKRSQQYERDSSILNLNILAYIMYAGAWMPYLVVTYRYPSSSNYRFYYSVWIGMLRSVITTIFYCMVNSSFKRAFVHLFDYCCCKSTLSNSFTNRHRRAVDYKNTTGEVSVHIMHKVLNAGSPQRATTSSAREMQEL